MKRNIAQFVQRCLMLQYVKTDHKKPPGLLVPLLIPEWKWTHITIDFVRGLPRTSQGIDIVWVIMDRQTKSTNFVIFPD